MRDLMFIYTITSIIHLLKCFKSCPFCTQAQGFFPLSFFLKLEIFKNLKVPSALRTCKPKPEDMLKKKIDCTVETFSQH